jgi:hypothetical protein
MLPLASRVLRGDRRQVVRYGSTGCKPKNFSPRVSFAFLQAHCFSKEHASFPKNLERTGEGFIMQSKSVKLALSLFSILLFGFTVVNAQLSDELRPFDFSNDYYKTNGVIAETLANRKNGADGQSVFDFATDSSRFTNIRITATLPAYAANGSSIYWNYYGTATKESFTTDVAGKNAAKMANTYPVYVFPSAVIRASDRQAALIPIDGSYFEANPIGIAEVVAVEFNDRISRSGRKTLNMLIERNGASIDGTPIIRTMTELRDLIIEGLVTLHVDENRPFAVAKVIQYPDRGGITSDAFLVYVKKADGKPLDAEQHFITRFECLKDGSRTCL